jgi:hypothetical protein
MPITYNKEKKIGAKKSKSGKEAKISLEVRLERLAK